MQDAFMPAIPIVVDDIGCQFIIRRIIVFIDHGRLIYVYADALLVIGQLDLIIPIKILRNRCRSAKGNAANPYCRKSND